MFDKSFWTGIGAATCVWMATSSAIAAISNTSPSAGETVTVDTSHPNPETMSIYSSADDVTVNVLEGAGIAVTGPQDAIRAGGDGWTVNNAGNLSSDYSVISFWGSADGELINLSTGTITNSDHGSGVSFDYDNSGLVTNAGTITTGEWGIGVFMGAGGTITNEAGGVIAAGNDAIRMFGAGDIINAGTIDGLGDTAINFSTNDDNDKLTLLPGSQIIGNVLAHGGTNTLTLAGDSGTDTFNVSHIGSDQQYRGFNVFVKDGDATWTLTGSGDQDWAINAGTLVGDTDSLQGDIENDATIVFNQTSNGTYAGSLSGTGELVKLGSGTLSMEHADNDLVIDAGAIRLTGASSGNVALNQAGTLQADADRNGVVTMNGGLLRGTGTLGELNAISGTIAPGNSIGTLSVTGDVTIGSDATLLMQVHGDGSADRLVVGGEATLASDSTIMVTLVGGQTLLKGGDAWEIITADGGLTDHGAQTTPATLAGLKLTGHAGSKSYILSVHETSIEASMMTSRGRSVAHVLDKDHSNDPTYQHFVDQVRNMSAEAAELTLLASTPETMEASQAMSQRVTRSSQGTVSNYLRSRRAGLPTLPQQMAGQEMKPGVGQLASAASNNAHTLATYLAMTEQQPAGSRPRPVDAGETPWSGFATIYSVFDDRDNRDDVLGARVETYAGQIGVDYQLNNNWLAGLSTTYAYSDLNFKGNRGGGKSHGLRVGPYGSFAHDQWFVDGSLTYGFTRNDIDRRNPGNGGEFSHRYNAHDLAASLAAGFDHKLDSHWTLTPEASLQYVHTWTDSYEESGGGGALAVGSHDFNSLRSTLGITVSRHTRIGNLTVLPQAGLGWAHEFLNDGDTLSARFVGGTSSFTIVTADKPRDSVFYSAGATALLDDRTTLNLRYEGETDSHGQTHAVVANLRFAF